MLVKTEHKLPIKIWAEEEDLVGYEDAIGQAANLANHPLAFKQVCLMPDYHIGYGMPIGGVFATLGGVVPNAVGVDIGCFAGETQVPLLDGTMHTLKDLAESLWEGWVYSLDDSGKVVPGKAKALKTRSDSPLVEVTVSGGQSITCTPDHLFMMRDGSYKPAKELAVKDSLMPFYRTYEGRDGYEHLLNPGGRSVLTHKMVAAYFGIEGEVIHHEDHNHLNNTPENLCGLSSSEHSKYHRRKKTIFNTEDFKRKRLATLKDKGFFDPSLLSKKQLVGRENLLKGQTTHPEAFAINYANAGKRGRETLIKILTSPYICKICGEISKNIGTHRWHITKSHNNHKVVSVRYLDKTSDVYCLQVDKHHNFALAAGVFVHNCNVLAVKTSLPADILDRATLQELRLEIHKQVPVGFAHRTEPSPFGYMPERPDFYECPVVYKNYDSGVLQLGTLGGGNHFIEIQKDESGFVWIMIHSGSRNIGKSVCDYYNKKAKELCERWKVELPSQDLAFLAEGDDLFFSYIKEMQWCMEFAKFNLQCMMDLVADAFITKNFPWSVVQNVYTMHNYAVQEHHFGVDPWVHRKGAVKADGLVCIPGSMGTASYIGVGLNNPTSFCSCSHGAGRVLGRREANKTITKDEAVDMMKDVVFGIRDGDYDEMPKAYKSIERVMDNQQDLVERTTKLTPLAVVKG